MAGWSWVENPLLVLNDIDMTRAAEIAAVGAFTHGGQICMSSARMLVKAPNGRAFAEALAKKAASLHLGDLRDERTAYGPLINQRAVEKVLRHVQAAKDGGAEMCIVVWSFSRRSSTTRPCRAYVGMKRRSVPWRW
jgi:aldehyde dehydrogenase (NAD+)